MRFYHDNAEIQHGADTREVDIGFQDTIVCGKFVDEEKPTFLEMMHAPLRRSPRRPVRPDGAGGRVAP